jgi:antitoxin HicB
MSNYTYTVHIEPAEEGGYNVFVPALPGCVTEGATYEEALAMAREAIEGHLEALAKVGAPIPTEPEPSHAITATVRVRSPVAV